MQTGSSISRCTSIDVPVATVNLALKFYETHSEGYGEVAYAVTIRAIRWSTPKRTRHCSTCLCYLSIWRALSRERERCQNQFAKSWHIDQKASEFNLFVWVSGASLLKLPLKARFFPGLFANFAWLSLDQKRFLAPDPQMIRVGLYLANSNQF